MVLNWPAELPEYRKMRLRMLVTSSCLANLFNFQTHGRAAELLARTSTGTTEETAVSFGREKFGFGND